MLVDNCKVDGERRMLMRKDHAGAVVVVVAVG